MSELIKNSENGKKIIDNNIIDKKNNISNNKTDVNFNIKKSPKKINTTNTNRIKKKDHNNNDLPMYLNRVKYKNNDRYEILIKNKKNKIKKTFTNSYLSMDEKLNNAKKELQNILNEMKGQSAGEI